MLNKLVQLNVIPDNPIKSVSKIRGPELKPIEFLTETEIDSLLEAATSTFRPIIYTFVKTGLRRNELLHLEWSDINFKKKQIQVINKRDYSTKNYRERYLPIDDKLIEIFQSRERGRSKYVFPTKTGSIRKNNLLREVKRTAQKAGIKKNDVIIQINSKGISKDEDVSVTLSNKLPGDKIEATILRDNVKKRIELRLMSADDWPKPKPINVLAGGNVYPNVIYDGFLVFDTEAMLNNFFKGAMIKLIIPLIGTEFTASDTPIHSFDFEFDFKMN
jgi:hypothetical protein